MKSQRFVSIVTLCVAISAVCGAEPVALEKEFLSPPDSAKPLTWRHWLGGTITRDGITVRFGNAMVALMLYRAGDQSLATLNPTRTSQ